MVFGTQPVPCWHPGEMNFAVPWPHTLLSSASGGVPAMLQQLACVLQRRMNEASGPYQMFQSLGDIVIFQRANGDDLTAKVMEEMPLAHAHKAFLDMPRLVWVFKYADDFHGPKVLGEDRVGTTNIATAELSNFLHPQIAFFSCRSEQRFHAPLPGRGCVYAVDWRCGDVTIGPLPTACH